MYIYICIYIYYNRYPTNIHLKQASFYWNMVDFYRYFTSIDGFTRLWSRQCDSGDQATCEFQRNTAAMMETRSTKKTPRLKGTLWEVWRAVQNFKTCQCHMLVTSFCFGIYCTISRCWYWRCWKSPVIWGTSGANIFGSIRFHQEKILWLVQTALHKLLANLDSLDSQQEILIHVHICMYIHHMYIYIYIYICMYMYMFYIASSKMAKINLTQGGSTRWALVMIFLWFSHWIWNVFQLGSFDRRVRSPRPGCCFWPDPPEWI